MCATFHLGLSGSYKDTTKKDKFSQKINAFHMDWGKEVIDIKNKKYKKREQKQRHKRTKDNPNAIFAYNYKTNKWEWRGKFDSKEENLRYTEAINKSTEYLKNLFN